MSAGFGPTRPGQFVQIGCRPPDGARSDDDVVGRLLEWGPGQEPGPCQAELAGPLALLRRPFSLADRGDDGDGAWVEILYRTVGVGTDWLANLRIGDPVDMIGPLGNGFDLPPDKSIGLLVAGGVGLGPMFHLARTLSDARWSGVSFIGSVSADLLPAALAPSTAPDNRGRPTDSVSRFSAFGLRSVVTTEDGSLGLAGRVTDGLRRHLDSQSPADARRTVVFTCGPEPMMRAVAELAAANAVACQVCLERAMACGMGTCQSCVVKVRDAGTDAAGRPGEGWRYSLTCVDGPVYPAEVVVW